MPEAKMIKGERYRTVMNDRAERRILRLYGKRKESLPQAISGIYRARVQADGEGKTGLLIRLKTGASIPLNVELSAQRVHDFRRASPVPCVLADRCEPDYKIIQSLADIVQGWRSETAH